MNGVAKKKPRMNKQRTAATTTAATTTTMHGDTIFGTKRSSRITEISSSSTTTTTTTAKNLTQKKIRINPVISEDPLESLDHYYHHDHHRQQYNNNTLKLISWNVGGLNGIIQKGSLKHYIRWERRECKKCRDQRLTSASSPKTGTAWYSLFAGDQINWSQSISR